MSRSLRRALLASAGLACVAAATLALDAATNAPVTVAIDAAANRRAISPLIYGVSYGTTAQLLELRTGLVRLGGNNTSRYNWQQNADNRGNDWYYESIPADSAAAGEEGDSFVAVARAAGVEPMLTFPMLPWVAKVGPNRSKLASFSIAKYGAQTDADWSWFPDAGNGIRTSGAYVTGNDPNDANVPNSTVLQQQWAQHLVQRWGRANAGGVRYYILDNEHSIWFSTHRDVAPTGARMDEVRDLMVDYAVALKAADPDAQIVGPEEWGWSGLVLSGYDQQYGALHGWDQTPDQDAHGGAWYLPYLLDQLRLASEQRGVRLLDVLTTHWYPQGGEFGNDVSQQMQLRRNRSTRSLWDPGYVDPTWIADTVRLVPRLREWVAQHYPGTRTGITEYNWGAEGHINGATAQADILGIFGREGLDLAARWVMPDPATPTYKAIKMYRNYDGAGGAFGDTSVRAVVPNPDELAAFAAVRGSDGALTVMVINKVLSGTTPVTLSLGGFVPTGSAAAWQLTSANSIARLVDLPVAGSSVSLSVPAQSLTMVVVPGRGGRRLLHDLDGDSVADFVGRDAVGGVSAFLVRGSQLTSAAWSSGFVPHRYDLFTGDVDGDGRSDLVSRARDSGNVEAFRSTGTAFAYTPGTGPSGVWSYGWGTSYELFLADVTGDGRADLIGRRLSNGDVWVFPSTGAGFSGGSLWSYGWSSGYELSFADATGDGRADLLGRYLGPSAGTGTVYVGRSTGGSFASPSGWTYGYTAGYRLQFADVDGDGRADLVARYVGPNAGLNGDVYVMVSTGSAFAWTLGSGRKSYGWGSSYELFVRDVTGDGRADLLSRRPDTGRVEAAPWTGAAFTYAGEWGVGFDAGWEMR